MGEPINKEQLRERILELEGLTEEEKLQLVRLLDKDKKYGLVWEDKPEEIEEQMREQLPVLTEVKERALTDGGEQAPNHVLIEGDNLAALTALSYTHEGKIDVIYIDPPYNTGNKDFVYNDSFVDSEDSYRHSKWLCFMSKRLKLAKQLLKSDGLIFISIDDNEQANLKILCDYVFGDQNYINTVSVKAKSSAGASGGGEDKKLKKNIEYLLIYCKDREETNIIFPLKKNKLIDVINEKKENGTSWLYTNIMYKKGNYNYHSTVPAGNGEDIKIYHVTDFEIKSVNEVMKIEGLTEEEVYNKYIDSIFTTENAQTSIRQRVKDAVGEDDEYYVAEYVPVSGRNKNKIIQVGFIGSTKRLISYLKYTCYFEENRVYKLDKIGTLWDDLSWSSVAGEGGVSFPAGKKPISLIERVINMHPNTDSVVLDFFAGSASTSHAVMDLNKLDCGKRQSIAITNNENKICEEKSYPRIKNVINGYGKKEGLHNNNLRYYKTEFLPREMTFDSKQALMRACVDLLCIKENIYTEVREFCGMKFKPSLLRYFNDHGRQMLFIFDERVIEHIVPMIAKMEGRMKIYVFSNGAYAYEDEFLAVKDKVELCALPEAILQAYHKVLPQREEEVRI